MVVGVSCTLNMFFQKTNEDYLNALYPLHQAGNVHMHSMLLFEKVEREKRETRSVSDSPHAKITKTNLEGPTTVNGIRVIEHPHEV
jgi:hypothetical protein